VADAIHSESHTLCAQPQLYSAMPHLLKHAVLVADATLSKSHTDSGVCSE